ncbi:MAG TPA: response regulator [Desulfobacterales bacterium]|nr:response regulator [Desulfobacterales bacterium]
MNEIALAGMTVLLAEDEEINAEVAVNMLEDKGLLVTAVRDGLEAVKCYKSRPFDIVLLDIMMPVMNGYLAAAEIRKFEKLEHRRPAVIIAMSALSDSDERRKWSKNGIDGYAAKPINWPALLRKIGHNAGSRRTVRPQTELLSCVIDYERFVDDMCNKNHELAASLINKFVSRRVGELIKAAEEAVKGKDIKRLREVCHSMIGVSRSMCADGLARRASELRQLAIEGSWPAMPGIIETMHKCHDNIMRWWETQLTPDM